MTSSRTVTIVSCWCLTLATALIAEDHPKCPCGYQPFADRCVSQRMSDYITCVERSGGNHEKITSEVSDATSGQVAGCAQGSGGTVVAKGSGSICIDKKAEQGLANRFEESFYSNAMAECREVLKLKVVEPDCPDKSRPKVPAVKGPKPDTKAPQASSGPAKTEPRPASSAEIGVDPNWFGSYDNRVEYPNDEYKARAISINSGSPRSTAENIYMSYETGDSHYGATYCEVSWSGEAKPSNNADILTFVANRSSQSGCDSMPLSLSGTVKRVGLDQVIISSGFPMGSVALLRDR